jgi:hypothetical protein
MALGLPLTEAYATGRAWCLGQFCDAASNLGSTRTFMLVPGARHKRPVPALLCALSPDAREAGLLAGDTHKTRIPGYNAQHVR